MEATESCGSIVSDNETINLTFDGHNPLLESTSSPQASTISSSSPATEWAPQEENSKSKEQTYKDKVADMKDKILSYGRGKSKKRSRNDIFLSTTLEIIQKHQQEADERCIITISRMHF